MSNIVVACQVETIEQCIDLYFAFCSSTCSTSMLLFVRTLQLSELSVQRETQYYAIFYNTIYAFIHSIFVMLYTAEIKWGLFSLFVRIIF